MSSYSQNTIERAEKLLLKALLEREELHKDLHWVEAGIKLEDRATEYAKRSAFKLAVDKLLENNDIDLRAGVQLRLDYDPAYLAQVAVARGWVRK